MTAHSALNKLLGMFAPEAKVLNWTERGWHSATFSGIRAEATIDFPGDSVVWGEAILDTINTREFALEGIDLVEATTIWVHRQIGGKAGSQLTCQIGMLLLDKAPARDLAA